jgi:hypothetical protein
MLTLRLMRNGRAQSNLSLGCPSESSIGKGRGHPQQLMRTKNHDFNIRKTISEIASPLRRTPCPPHLKKNQC